MVQEKQAIWLLVPKELIHQHASSYSAKIPSFYPHGLLLAYPSPSIAVKLRLQCENFIRATVFLSTLTMLLLGTAVCYIPRIQLTNLANNNQHSPRL